ncbi:hypothetical protein AYO20_00239 [Fonsecaea nubica]|uniref:Transcriptional regulator n=1 Tax=Fonsecaea nubica TaxID=856822 RepID=A0A178DH16_9EURO|nr:hypothetical protein AYO20_00239 [Fonsecaea nubica]OAL40503.1 hypothetical protein AYO20_00239 [Fonsecaea nubica]
MYLRAVHAETRLKPLIELIQNNPLGLLSTAISSDNFPLIQHTYIPWVLDPPRNLAALEADGQADRAPVGNVKQPVQGLEGCKLRGHMAKANPHAKAVIEATGPGNGCLPTEVTVSFAAPSQHYISPKWYVQTKPENGKVVPTWNYVAVEVRGTARIFHDKEAVETGQYLQTQVEDLTKLSESRLGYDSTPKAELAVNGQEAGGKGTAWEVGDAPKPYIEIMKKAIIGIEIDITSIVGKWKMSQELKTGDRQGVKDGLRELDDVKSRSVAEIVEMKSNTWRAIVGTCFVAAGTYSGNPIAVAWISTIHGGYTKRSTVYGIQQVFINSFIIMSTQVFDTPPKFYKGNGILLGIFAVAFASTAILYFWLRAENRKRDRAAQARLDGTAPPLPDDIGDFETLCDYHPDWRYPL